MGALEELADFLERVKTTKSTDRAAHDVKADLDALTRQTRDVAEKIVCDVQKALDAPES